MISLSDEYIFCSRSALVDAFVARSDDGPSSDLWLGLPGRQSDTQLGAECRASRIRATMKATSEFLSS